MNERWHWAPAATGALIPPSDSATWAAESSAGNSWWLNCLCVTLLGYALFGRGWAYLGVPPLFIGEIVLLLGVVSISLCGRLSGLFRYATTHWLMLLAAWGSLCTFPYWPVHRVDAIRDAVIWGYGVFGVVVYSYVLAKPRRLKLLLHRYRQFAWIYPFAVPAIWLVSRFFEGAIPHWPWAEVPMFDAKGGDLLVHLAGVMAFWVAGFGGDVSKWRVFVLSCAIAMVGAFNRGGLVSVLAAGGLCTASQPRNRTLWRIAGVGVLGMTLLAASGLEFELPGKQREISFAQLVVNLTSIFESRGDELSGTKEWRLQWWSDIYNYTVNGRYFWMGKGFGVNLADDDGYQGSDWEGRLRSPHNGHLTMLARAGVPGFVLWVLVQGTWAWAVAAGYWRSRRAGDETWSHLFLFLLAYWTAFMANATFDVFLEGPMGGVWFWTLYGLGLAALTIYERDPEVLTAPPAGD